MQKKKLRFFVTLEDKHPIGLFLLALAEGPSSQRRALSDGRTDRGAKGGPFGPINNKHDDGRTGCQRRVLREN